MKASVVKRWVGDLLSGKFKQGTGYLSKHRKHCCLGVLRTQLPGALRRQSLIEPGQSGGQLLNKAQLEYLGMTNAQQNILATANDDEKTFAQIVAQHIKRMKTRQG